MATGEHGPENIFESNFDKEVICCSIPVLVEFEAKWSGACHIVRPILERLSLAYRQKIKVYHVDIDCNESLKKRFSIHDLPTVLFFESGNIIDHYFGLASEEILTEKIEKILQES